MSTRLYPVKDLILVRNEKDEIETEFQPLLDLITNTVVTKNWAENGGKGSITGYQFQDRCLLVVSQTEEVHEQIAALLACSDAPPPRMGKAATRCCCRSDLLGDCPAPCCRALPAKPRRCRAAMGGRWTSRREKALLGTIREQQPFADSACSHYFWLRPLRWRSSWLAACVRRIPHRPRKMRVIVLSAATRRR